VQYIHRIQQYESYQLRTELRTDLHPTLVFFEILLLLRATFTNGGHKVIKGDFPNWLHLGPWVYCFFLVDHHRFIGETMDTWLLKKNKSGCSKYHSKICFTYADCHGPWLVKLLMIGMRFNYKLFNTKWKQCNWLTERSNNEINFNSWKWAWLCTLLTDEIQFRYHMSTFWSITWHFLNKMNKWDHGL
jgi:hypothetical protein